MQDQNLFQSNLPQSGYGPSQFQQGPSFQQQTGLTSTYPFQNQGLLGSTPIQSPGINSPSNLPSTSNLGTGQLPQTGYLGTQYQQGGVIGSQVPYSGGFQTGYNQYQVGPSGLQLSEGQQWSTGYQLGRTTVVDVPVGTATIVEKETTMVP